MDCFKHLGYCPKCARFLIITPPLRISPEIDWYHYQVVFNQRSSSIKYCLPSKVIFYQMLSSIKGSLPSKLVLHYRLSLIKGYITYKVVLHQMSSSIAACSSSCCCVRGKKSTESLHLPQDFEKICHPNNWSLTQRWFGTLHHNQELNLGVKGFIVHVIMGFIVYYLKNITSSSLNPEQYF